MVGDQSYPVSYTHLIAYVAQDNYLFNETVRENIRQGNPNATDEQVVEVTKKSGCYEFIMQLENGFDTVVGGAGDVYKRQLLFYANYDHEDLYKQSGYDCCRQ